MTIEKIKELNLPDSTYVDGTRQIEIKINEIIDVVNSLTNLYPKDSLTGGEKCEHGGECYSDNGYSKTIPFGYCAKFYKPEPKSECKHKNTGTCLACYGEAIEPKSNTLRESITDMLCDGKSTTDQILSLVKETIVKELPESNFSNLSVSEIKQIIENL